MRLTPDEHYVLIAFPDRILIYSLDRTSDSATVRERWEAEASTTGISLTDLAIVGDDRIALAWTNRVEMRALADGAIRWQHDPADASLGASSLAIDAATRTLAVGWSGRRGQWDTGGSIDLLDLDTGRQRTQVPQGGAWQLAFSQGDGSLVSVDYEATGQDSTIQYQAWLTIRARDSGAVLRREQLFTTHLLSIPTYRFSPNGDRLLAFSHGTSGLQIRDIQTGCSVVSTVPPLSTAATIADMQFALTADRLIATTTEGTIIGWSPTTDAAGWQFRAVITAASFSGATLTADGRLVFFVTPDYALRAWIVAPH